MSKQGLFTVTSEKYKISDGSHIILQHKCDNLTGTLKFTPNLSFLGWEVNGYSHCYYCPGCGIELPELAEVKKIIERKKENG